MFFLGLAIAFGLVALAGTWKPELGLDLQGGTSIRLTPKGNPSAESLEEARKIIDQRVNGSGVAEAEVTVQGNRFIVVEIPGESRRDLVDTVKRQAQLRFRLVACSDVNPGACASGATTPTPQDPTQPSNDPGTGVTAPATPSAGETTAPSDAASPSDDAPASDAPTRPAPPTGRRPATRTPTSPSSTESTIRATPPPPTRPTTRPTARPRRATRARRAPSPPSRPPRAARTSATR